jgi:hypothetical protein
MYAFARFQTFLHPINHDYFLQDFSGRLRKTEEPYENGKQQTSEFLQFVQTSIFMHFLKNWKSSKNP